MTQLPRWWDRRGFYPERRRVLLRDGREGLVLTVRRDEDCTDSDEFDIEFKDGSRDIVQRRDALAVID